MTPDSFRKKAEDDIDFVLTQQLQEHLGGIADGSAWAIRMNVRQAVSKALHQQAIRTEAAVRKEVAEAITKDMEERDAINETGEPHEKVEKFRQNLHNSGWNEAVRIIHKRAEAERMKGKV